MSKKQSKVILSIVFIVGFTALFFWLGGCLETQAAAREQAAFDAKLTAAMPDGGHFSRLQLRDDAEYAIQAAYGSDSGTVVSVKVDGYAGPMVVLVGVDAAGAVTGVYVDEQRETRGLGDRVQRERWFTEQFSGQSGKLTLDVEIDALAGATVSSRAVTRAVNLALGYIGGTDAGIDVGSGATAWEG